MRAARSLKCLHTVSTPESLPDIDSPGVLSPKFAQGDLVRIRTISEEEASRVFKASGIHWNSSKAALLGTVGELRSVGSDYYAVYTPDQSDWWRWPLAMLERADGTSVRRPGSREGPFCEGQLVKILEMSEEEAEGICLAWSAAMSPIADWGWPEHEAVFSPRELITIEEDTTRSAQAWSAPMADALGQQGRVEAVFRQRCRVATSGGCFWWPFSALEALRCPDGHTLEEVYASDGACCATCSRDLTEERCGRCDACRLDLCSSCADQAQLARTRGFVEGAVVRMTMDDTDIEWDHCPGGCMSFSRGTRCTIQSLRGGWFSCVEEPGHLAPLAVAELIFDQEYVEDVGFRETCEDRAIKEIKAIHGRGSEEEWASMSTEEGIDPKSPSFMLATRDSCRVALCEPCWNFCQAAEGICPICRQQSTGAVEAFRERWDVQRQGRHSGDASPPPAERLLQEDPAQRKVAWTHGMALLAEDAKCCGASYRQGMPMEDLLEQLRRQKEEIHQLRREKEALEQLLSEKM